MRTSRKKRRRKFQVAMGTSKELQTICTSRQFRGYGCSGRTSEKSEEHFNISLIKARKTTGQASFSLFAADALLHSGVTIPDQPKQIVYTSCHRYFFISARRKHFSGEDRFWAECCPSHNEAGRKTATPQSRWSEGTVPAHVCTRDEAAA